MLIIHCPDNLKEERAYIVDVLLKEFLGLDYDLNVGSGTDYRLLLENGNELILRDHFFSKFNKGPDYLKIENIPEQVVYTSNSFLCEDDIPILYGDQDLHVTEEDSGYKKIECGIDVFASCFFMLTRWEEHVSRQKDTLGRFTSRQSVSVKHNFLERPIVNEYTEFLWNMLKYIGISAERSPRVFSTYLTHDVDYILRWHHPGNLFRALAGALIKKRSLKALIHDLQDFLLTKTGKKKDPFDTFDDLMTLSENHGLKSHFFFMSVDRRRQRHHYRLSHPFVKKLMADIDARGHCAGFHPGMGSFKDPVRWNKEAERLSAFIPGRLQFGRQHCLQFQVPDTWQIWNDFGMTWDSTLSYDDAPGFRTGCCYPYSVFNCLTRKKLVLKERPLIIMDTALVLKNSSMQNQQMEAYAKGLIDKVIKYRGDFVFLWHNSSFNLPEWKPYEKLYDSLVTYAQETSN